MKLPLPALALLLPAMACAHGQRVEPQPPPAWSSREGRHEARLEMAHTMMELGRHREALAVLTQAREESGPELELDVLQARTYLALGMTSEAAALLEPWERKSPRELDYHLAVGLVRFDQNQLEDAEAAFLRAIDLDDRSFDAHNNLGFLLLVSERPEQALPRLRRALELHPGDARARSNLAFALAALEKDKEALELLRTLHPLPVAYSNMGLACERRGQPDAALDWYQRALELEAEQPMALEAIQRLAPPPQGDPKP